MLTKELIGAAAGLLALAAYPIYIRAIVTGSTVPNRATWWIIALVGSLIASSYWVRGARETIWIALTYTVGPLMIAVLSLRYGEGRWERVDKGCLFAALGSAALWLLVRSAQTALVLNVVIDFFGLIPTIRKAVYRPWTEDRTAWALAALASILNLFAVDEWNFAVAAYPVYLLVTNCLIAGLLSRRARRAA